MPVLKANDAVMTTVKEGVQRRLIHTDELMMVVIDFDDGPVETTGSATQSCA